MSTIKWALPISCAAALLLAGSASTVTPVPRSGPISLVGTVVEHHSFRTDKFPGRETWYFSLASVRRKGRAFGYGVLACSFVSTKNTIRQCTGTFSLPLGKISVNGSFLYSILYNLSVTGGTDEYVGVAGILQVRQFVNSKSSYWITFELK